MGLVGKIKTWLKVNYPSSWKNETEVRESRMKMPKVVIFDISYVFKYSNASYQCGLDFVNKQFIGEFDPSFKAGALIVYVCIDRGAPPNKFLEHLKRYGKLAKCDSPKSQVELQQLTVSLDENELNFIQKIDSRSSKQQNLSQISQIGVNEKNHLDEKKEGELGKYLVMRDDRMPKKDLWSAVNGNTFLKRQILHYVTHALTLDLRFEDILFRAGVRRRQGIHCLGYTPPKGAILCLHGGLTSRPEEDGSMIYHTYDPETNTVYWESKPYEPDDHVVLITEEENHSTGKLIRNVSQIVEHYPPRIVKNLKEGEIAAMYYSQNHMDEDHLIVTVDGDVILLALLGSRYRLIPKTNKFRNTLHLRLKLPGKRKKVGTKSIPSSDDYLNINDLYHRLIQTKGLRDYQDPISVFVMVSSLLGNDYIKGFSVGGLNGTKSDMPLLLYVLLYSSKMYKNMIKITQIEANGELCSCNVDIDEILFYRYAMECYYCAYGDLTCLQRQIMARLNNLDLDSPNLNDYDKVVQHDLALKTVSGIIKRHLADKKTPMMSKSTILAYCRRIKWLLEYWINGYKGDCYYPDPCKKIGGVSYYGWEYIIQQNDSSESEGRKVCVPTNEVYHERGETLQISLIENTTSSLEDLSIGNKTKSKPTKNNAKALNTNTDGATVVVDLTEKAKTRKRTRPTQQLQSNSITLVTKKQKTQQKNNFLNSYDNETDDGFPPIKTASMPSKSTLLGSKTSQIDFFSSLDQSLQNMSTFDFKTRCETKQSLTRNYASLY